MPWETKGDFIAAAYSSLPTKNFSPEQVWEARELMGRCIHAMQDGSIRGWYPTPGKKLDAAYVEQAIATIDREWALEARKRGRRLCGSPGFSDLTLEQKACLVERLIKILYGDGDIVSHPKKLPVIVEPTSETNYLSTYDP